MPIRPPGSTPSWVYPAEPCSTVRHLRQEAPPSSLREITAARRSDSSAQWLASSTPPALITEPFTEGSSRSATGSGELKVMQQSRDRDDQRRPIPRDSSHSDPSCIILNQYYNSVT